MDDKLKISEDAKKKATKCHRNFACLSGNKPGVCKEFCAIDDILFVKKNKEICNYFVPFGYRGYCTCPVREEIHNNYNI